MLLHTKALTHIYWDITTNFNHRKLWIFANLLSAYVDVCGWNLLQQGNNVIDIKIPLSCLTLAIQQLDFRSVVNRGITVILFLSLRLYAVSPLNSVNCIAEIFILLVFCSIIFQKRHFSIIRVNPSCSIALCFQQVNLANTPTHHPRSV